MLSQTVKSYGPIYHSVIGPAPVIIHPEPLIPADVKSTPRVPPYLLTVWTLSLGNCRSCISSEHFLNKVN